MEKLVYTVKEPNEVMIEVEKSKFIASLFPINKEEDVNYYLTKIMKEHPKARHHCYAYILGDKYKYSDDGEPQGTAGRPMYNQLEVSNLTNVLVIVTRYFGGTLLGSGRLLRTYVKSVQEAIKEAKLVQIVKMKKFRVEIDVDIYSQFLNFVNKNQFIITNTLFSDRITIDFIAPLDFNEELESIYYPKLKVIGSIPIDYRKE